MFPQELTGSKNICILAPHQDDEVLGMGGTLSYLVSNNKNIQIIFTTDGGRGIKNSPALITKLIRKAEFNKVNKLLNNKLEVIYCDFPDGKLQEHLPSLQNKLQNIVQDFQPDLIFCPNSQDWHPDHKATYNALKNIALDNLLKATVYLYEVWSPLSNVNLLVNITEFAEQKRQLINAYKSQTSKMDFEFILMGLNAYRSMFLSKNQRIVGKQNYAEGFTKETF
jgi:LmbE family N-acetylglucosaminyl deacetylase